MTRLVKIILPIIRYRGLRDLMVHKLWRFLQVNNEANLIYFFYPSQEKWLLVELKNIIKKRDFEGFLELRESMGSLVRWYLPDYGYFSNEAIDITTKEGFSRIAVIVAMPDLKELEGCAYVASPF